MVRPLLPLPPRSWPPPPLLNGERIPPISPRLRQLTVSLNFPIFSIPSLPGVSHCSLTSLLSVVLPTGVPRGLTQSECLRGSAKLAHRSVSEIPCQLFLHPPVCNSLSSACSGSKSCHTPRGPPSSVCTKGQPLSESLSSSIAICYENDWVWFAMGAIAVAGAMFAGNRFYTTMQGRAEGKARCVSTRAMMI